MADPERKKKLEAIKRRKQELARQLHSSSNQASAKTDEKSVEEMAREVLKNTTKEVNEFIPEDSGSKPNFMVELLKKKFNQSLGKTSLSEIFIGRKPELYDEFCQCEENKASDDDNSDNENEIAKQRQKKTYEPLIIRKHHVQQPQESGEQPFDNRPKSYNVIPEEERKDFLDKKKEEVIDFVAKEKKVIERALNEKNIFEMFRKDAEDKFDLGLGDNKTKPKKKLIYPICEFFDELCAKRVVTSLEWSLKHQELLLTSFSKADDFNLNQQNGLILLWSLALRKTPEFTFRCQAEVTSSIFHPYNPKMVIGGTFTGQVLFWDTRGKSTPINKTPLGIGGGNSGKTHSGPITCLGVTGSTNSNHVISVSSGVICIWSLSNLSKPVKRIELVKKKIEFKNALEEIGCLSMGLQQFESNNLLVGSDDNEVYQVSLHGNENSSNIVSTFKGHEGPIYSIDIHPVDYFNMGNFSHLFLTSSADWTTRLWTKTQPDAPLATLDANEDYVYCSKWCPTNASVFACGDGSGNLDFWDLNKDMEIPKYRHQMKDVINKLSWSDDGRRLAVGDDKGKVSILGISKDIYWSKVEDSLKFEKLVNKLKMNK